MRVAGQFQPWLSLLVCCVLLVPPGSIADKKEVIRQAKESYYNLPSQGLLEVQIAVTPNWAAVLRRELKSDIPPDHPALKLLGGLHFWLSLDQKGTARISHQIDTAPANQKSMADFHQTVSGVEEMLSGFATSIGPYLFTSPFPEIDSEYQLEEMSEQYRLTYKQGQFDVVTIMKKNFTITYLQVTGSAFTGSVKPQFIRTARGLLISGYQSTYQAGSEKLTDLVSAQIEYKDVEGFQLPERILIDTTSKASNLEWELRFSDYQVKKRKP